MSSPKPQPGGVPVRPSYLPRKLLPVVPAALLPARMLNELLYCERLMYLEWVQGEWADNYFTKDGTRVHKRADQPRPLKKAQDREGSTAADPQEEKPYQARSVWLSSDKLGITAKIDVIDVEGNRVVPIEYKRGKRPDVAEGAWLPERAQLCAHVLLLREHGYDCEKAAIYFAGDRQRVDIAITEELIAVVRRAVERARALCEEGQLPPPLTDSPKCRGCSLVGICLPDEVNLLARMDSNTAKALLEADPGKEEELEDDEPDPWGLTPPRKSEPPAVRRLYAARDDKLPLYVQEQGARIRLTGERLRVEGRESPTVEARLGNTSQVALYGNVQVSTQAVRELLNRCIPLTFHTSGGWLVGRAGGFNANNVELRQAQYRATLDPATCLRFAAAFIESKIQNCRTLLRRNHASPNAVALSSLKQLANKARDADDIAVLLGIEGSAARVYFEEFTGMLKANGEQELSFELNGRNRRPPRDPVNALLSFSYSLLTKEVTLAVTNVGLDPMLGVYHQPHFGRPALALDLMEEFRPLIADSAVISAINNGVLDLDDFTHAAGSVALRPAARRRFIHAFERRMDQLITHPIFDYRVSYRRVLELQARLFSRVLLGEIEQYPTFRTR